VQEALMKRAQEASMKLAQEVPMTQAREAPMMQAHEVLMMQAQERSGATLLQGAPARAVAVVVATDALLGIDDVEADGIEPRLDDAARSSWLDLVVHCSGPSSPRCTTPRDAVLAPKFLGAVDPGVAGLGLPGFFSPPFPPIDREVDGE
jgi:hypothetical protein